MAARPQLTLVGGSATAQIPKHGFVSKLTRLSITQPASVGKHFSLSSRGELIKTTEGRIFDAQASIERVSSLTDLARLLGGLKSNEVLTYGVPNVGATARIVTKRTIGQHPGAITRTDTDFGWSSGPGVLVLDHDPSPRGCAFHSLDEFAAAVRSAVPGLEHVDMLGWYSSSSFIFKRGVRGKPDRDLSGLRGMRLWILVRDALDIVRAGRVLHDRLWSRGARLGYIALSSNGNRLVRCVVDASVWTPSHVDFAAGAVVGPGLEQRRGDPVLLPGTPYSPKKPADEFCDTARVFRDLSTKESAELRERIKSAKNDPQLVNEARQVAEAWVEARAQALFGRVRARLSRSKRPAALDAARAAARSVLDSGEADSTRWTLPKEYLLYRADTRAAVSVAEILTDPSAFGDVEFADPLEPEYDDGRAVAKLLPNSTPLTVNSFARGGRTFVLAGDALLASASPTEGGTDASAPGWIRAINARFAWDMLANQIYDIEASKYITDQSFRNAVATTPGGSGLKTAGEWLSSPMRGVQRGLGFDPEGGRFMSDGARNTWSGLAVEPWGSPVTTKDIRPWLDVFEWMAGATPPKYALDWLAHKVQRPNVKMKSSLLFWSAEQGTGKGLTFEPLLRIFGPHGLHMNGRHLTGNFNHLLADRLFVLADELGRSDIRMDSDALKYLVTETDIRIERKYQDARICKSLIDTVFLSNHANAVYIDRSDRRFFVWRASNAKLPEPLREALVHWMEKESGCEKLLRWLLDRPLDGFDPFAKPPETEAWIEMVEANFSDLERWLHEAVANNGAATVFGREVVKAEELAHDFRCGRVATSTTAVTRSLAKLGFDVRRKVKLESGRTVRLTAIARPEYWEKQDPAAWKAEFEKPHRLG
ncbi:MAG: DUF5906 domain-containing protein [Burkholderiaceae bacterium]|jgi:hypothetical protein|nr:DUF5906 domain-containing protein [Burkholderiaceae bacterium]